jgi:ATP-dependent Lon protease
MPRIEYAEPELEGLPREPTTMGCLTLERTVLLPGTVQHYQSVDPDHFQLLLDAAHNQRLLLVCPTAPDGENLHDIGVIARIVDVTKESDTRAAFDLHGLARVHIGELVETPAPYPVVRITPVEEHAGGDDRADELVQSIRGALEQLADQGYDVAQYALDQALSLHQPGVVADMVGATALHSTDEHRELLDEISVSARLETVEHALAELLKESDVLYPTSRDSMN